MPGAAPGTEKHWPQAQPGRGVAGERLSRKGPGGAGQQLAQCEPTVSPGSQEGKLHFGVCYTQHSQPVKRGDSPAIFSVGVASP